MVQIPNVTFNNGKHIPIIGLGTSQGTSKGLSWDVAQSVKDAIDIGYRHIDCAFYYKNEKEVGIGISSKIAEGVVKREDLFVTSKLWNTFHRAGQVETAIRQTLKNLDLEYLDLYLIHWPMAYREVDSVMHSRNVKKNVEFSDYDYVDTWKAMEEIEKKGLAKSIGLSNFNKHQIERILEKAEIIPAVNQIECHPYFSQNQLINFCRSKNIQITAFSPLGAPGRHLDNPNYPNLLEDPRLKVIARKYSKSPAQIALRWQIQKAIVVIPKSSNKKRLQENLEIFDFEISLEDMSIIEAFNSNLRFVHLSEATSHPLYPFNDEY